MLVLTRMAKVPPYNVPNWSTASDAAIIEALRRHYDPDDPTDVTEVWSVGDERTFHLSAMSATGVGESHIEQDVTMVLMHVGGRELVEPINGKTECAFIVGQKDGLTAGTDTYWDEGGYIHHTSQAAINWSNCDRRTWCNSVYKNAMPASISSIFKQFKNTSNDISNTDVVTDDYFSLPAEKEVYGASNPHPYAAGSGESSLIQFKYYETSSNREKNLDSGGDGLAYWTRTVGSDSIVSYTNFVKYAYIDYGTRADANDRRNIAPFGVI